MIWAGKKKIKEMNHLNTMYYNDILFSIFKGFFFPQVSYYTGMLVYLLVQTQSLTAKEKPIFYASTLIYRTYLQNVNC